jgi:C-terminal processing protease CtpA/Prc
VTAAIFKANKMGITVGQETRGRVKFCSDPVSMPLPNTKLIAQIPLAIYTLPGDNPDRGVIPDIKVIRNIDDFRGGKDIEMEAVKTLIVKQHL